MFYKSVDFWLDVWKISSLTDIVLHTEIRDGEKTVPKYFFNRSSQGMQSIFDVLASFRTIIFKI